MMLYIGLSSCLLTNTSRLARMVGFIGACQLSPQKDNVGIQKFFFPWFWLSKLSKIYFFQRPVMPPHFWALIHGVIIMFLTWLKINLYFQTTFSQGFNFSNDRMMPRASISITMSRASNFLASIRKIVSKSFKRMKMFKHVRFISYFSSLAATTVVFQVL